MIDLPCTFAAVLPTRELCLTPVVLPAYIHAAESKTLIFSYVCNFIRVRPFLRVITSFCRVLVYVYRPYREVKVNGSVSVYGDAFRRPLQLRISSM